MPTIAVDNTIEVTVNTNGVLSYSDGGSTTLKAQRADTVQWVCKTHEYEIQFNKDPWPFREPIRLLRKGRGASTGPCTAEFHRSGTNQKNFKYTVSVYDSGGNPMIVDDPIIIVDDE